MARKKSYSPVASYEQLKQAETSINKAETAVDIREATKQVGAKIGYKHFVTCLLKNDSRHERNATGTTHLSDLGYAIPPALSLAYPLPISQNGRSR